MNKSSLIIITENGFVVGEGITTSNWATVTTVAEGGVANTFDYALLDGMRSENCAITVVTYQPAAELTFMYALGRAGSMNPPRRSRVA